MFDIMAKDRHVTEEQLAAEAEVQRLADTCPPGKKAEEEANSKIHAIVHSGLFSQEDIKGLYHRLDMVRGNTNVRTYVQFIRELKTRHSDEHKLWAMNYWHTVTFIHNYCSVHNLPLFMFNVFAPPCDMEEVVNSSWNARGYMHSVHHKEGDVLAPGKHPNEKGSIILAERLHHMIDSAKIL